MLSLNLDVLNMNLYIKSALTDFYTGYTVYAKVTREKKSTKSSKVFGWFCLTSTVKLDLNKNEKETYLI